MGVDIQTFRMRIGLFNGRRLRIFLRCGSFKNKNVLSALAIAIIIGQALMVGCVELNPGPDDEVGAVGSNCVIVFVFLLHFFVKIFNIFLHLLTLLYFGCAR